MEHVRDGRGGKDRRLAGRPAGQRGCGRQHRAGVLGTGAGQVLMARGEADGLMAGGTRQRGNCAARYGARRVRANDKSGPPPQTIPRLPPGELLTEMERRGMMVNRAHLAEAQRRAEADRAEALREFLEWADSKVPGAR